MIWVIDNGHGGVDESGVYHTESPDKKSPILPDGTVLLEGDWNRTVARQVASRISNSTLLVPEVEDVPITERLRRCAEIPGAFLLSIHMNGHPHHFQTYKSGSTVFYNRYNEGRAQAMQFQDELGLALGFRGIFEGSYAIINHQICPALLLECGFMNNISDVMFLKTPEGIETTVTAICKGIRKCEKILN